MTEPFMKAQDFLHAIFATNSRFDEACVTRSLHGLIFIPIGSIEELFCFPRLCTWTQVRRPQLLLSYVPLINFVDTELVANFPVVKR
jgi:hypothetical protein